MDFFKLDESFDVGRMELLVTNAYSSLGLTIVLHKTKALSIVEKQDVISRNKPSIFKS